MLNWYILYNPKIRETKNNIPISESIGEPGGGGNAGGGGLFFAKANPKLNKTANMLITLFGTFFIGRKSK